MLAMGGASAQAAPPPDDDGDAASREPYSFQHDSQRRGSGPGGSRRRIPSGLLDDGSFDAPQLAGNTPGMPMPSCFLSNRICPSYFLSIGFLVASKASLSLTDQWM
jgi:hypothetical protein